MMTDSPVLNKNSFTPMLPPTKIKPGKGKILVTGATGYIGSRLVPELLARGYSVRAMVLSFSREYKKRWPGAEIVEGNTHDIKSLKRALNDIHTAYYLIPSRRDTHLTEEMDIISARNFSLAAKEMGLKRIVYLCKIPCYVKSRRSQKLHPCPSAVEKEFKKSKIPVTGLMTCSVIGSGSALYEIIVHLIKKIPVLPVPVFDDRCIQASGIIDVLKSLIGTIELPGTENKNFYIGGPEKLNFRSIFKIAARAQNKKIILFPLPFCKVLYNILAAIITPVNLSFARCVFNNLKLPATSKADCILRYSNIEKQSFEEAIKTAVNTEKMDRIFSRWTDAYPVKHELSKKLHELKAPPRYRSRYSIRTSKSPRNLFNSISRIGGEEGWLRHNWMWRLRSIIDRVLFGVGSARGRRSLSSLKTNDVIDIWRVETVKPPERLLLRAEMKLPGRAWLEFNIKREGRENILSLLASYDTDSLAGKIYWYFFLPFHHLIFPDLIKQIEARS